MIQLEVWGDYACFTRPEFSTERVSYDVMTPSAARAILESIFWHPGITYRIQKIYLLSPIEFVNIRVNEVGEKIPRTALAHLRNGKALSLTPTGNNRQQRAQRLLRNPHYVIQADFALDEDKLNPSDNSNKFYSMLTRRAEKGQCYRHPYFGMRDFPVDFRLWPGGDIPTVPITKDLGYMLYDQVYLQDYGGPYEVRPYFFDAKLVNGVLDLTDCEVIC